MTYLEALDVISDHVNAVELCVKAQVSADRNTKAAYVLVLRDTPARLRSALEALRHRPGLRLRGLPTMKSWSDLKKPGEHSFMDCVGTEGCKASVEELRT